MPKTQLPPRMHREKSSVEISHRRAEGVFLKLSLGALFGFLLLVALIWGGRGAYVRWQTNRLITKADAALQQGDTQGASLAARAVLQLKPESVPAARILAEVAERSGDNSALTWRRKVIEMPDHSVDDVLAMARSAVQFNDIETAKSVLGQIEAAGRATGGFHAVAASIAQAEKQTEIAAKEWEEAVRLSPQEKNYQLQLGVAKLRQNDPGQREAGLSLLNNLRADPKYRAPATRTLITDAVARRERSDKVMELVRALNSYPEATFGDAVLLADVLRQTNEREFASYLTELEKRAVGKSQDLVTLLFWMSQANLNLLAADFIKGLKPELLQPWPAPMAVADVYVRLQDWTKLETALKTADWRNYDFMRHAYLARSLRGQEKTVEADREWGLAMKGTTGGSDHVMMLLRIAGSWGWKEQEIDLLWALTKYPDKGREAIQTLYSYYQKNRDTQGLYRVLVRMAEDKPDNPDVQNNLAQISLLLDAKTEDARRLAADVYRKFPGNPAYATTYAYALLTKGDVQGAAKIMGSLTDEQLKDPAVSAYYGLCLAALKDPRARTFLENGERANLLPQERALLEKARNSLP